THPPQLAHHRDGAQRPRTGGAAMTISRSRLRTERCRLLMDDASQIAWRDLDGIVDGIVDHFVWTSRFDPEPLQHVAWRVCEVEGLVRERREILGVMARSGRRSA